MDAILARSAVLLGLCCFCFAGVGCTREAKSAAQRQMTVEAVDALQESLEVPGYFLEEDAKRTGEEFDPNQYFTILSHLSMEPGYVLDYVYNYDFMGGFPVLYARPADQPRYPSLSAYAEAVGADPLAAEARASFLDHVRVDGTAEGFFQYVVFLTQAGQFYLHWHANYNDAVIVCDPAGLERLLSSFNAFDLALPEEVKEGARELQPEPVVKFTGDTVQVQILTFSKWGGFSRESYTVSRSFPHKILDSKVDVLVPYDCGVLF